MTNKPSETVHIKQPKSVCIIGAGPCGLPAIKSCLEYGHEPVCYERTSDLGGRWNYRNLGEGNSTVMRNTRLINSKEILAYSDFPPATEYYNLMHHTAYNKYLHEYVKAFDLGKFITYNTNVEQVTPASDYEETGAYMVKLSNEETERFDAVLVANGHCHKPRIPVIDGIDTFKGKIIHSQQYYERTDMTKKRVLIVGAGNSALDIATDIAVIAERCWIATANGQWIQNRVGERSLPFDTEQLTRYRNSTPQWFINDWVESRLNRKLDHNIFGLKPDHRMLEKQPLVMNDHLANYTMSGRITIKDGVARVEGSTVHLLDTSIIENVDVIVYATGYQVDMPFLSEEALNVENQNEGFEMYKHVLPVSKEHPTLGFIGLVESIGPHSTVAEMQSRWISAVLADDLKLPSLKKMSEKSQQDRAFNQKRFVNNWNNWMQVEYINYMDDLANDLHVKPSIGGQLFGDASFWQHLVYCPMTSYVYRLTGDHAWPGARDAIMSVPARMTGAYKWNSRCKPLAPPHRGVIVKALSHIYNILAMVLLGLIYGLLAHYVPYFHNPVTFFLWFCILVVVNVAIVNLYFGYTDVTMVMFNMDRFNRFRWELPVHWILNWFKIVNADTDNTKT